MYQQQLKSMFSEMVEKKDADLIPYYYHPDFKLYANGEVQNYADFLDFHEKIYSTKIRYQVSYDEHAFVEQGDKLAARIFFQITDENGISKDLEVILICQFKAQKIFRVWELCYPDWKNMSAFL